MQIKNVYNNYILDMRNPVNIIDENSSHGEEQFKLDFL